MFQFQSDKQPAKATWSGTGVQLATLLDTFIERHAYTSCLTKMGACKNRVERRDGNATLRPAAVLRRCDTSTVTSGKHGKFLNASVSPGRRSVLARR